MIANERIEAVARAFCVAAGINPDQIVAQLDGSATRAEEPPFNGPIWYVPQWMNFRSMAFDRLAMDQAIAAVLNRPQGPEDGEK